MAVRNLRSSPEEYIHILVLAAGASHRLGVPKQLVRFHGRSLIRSATRAAIGLAGRNVTVVLGAHSRQVEVELRNLDVNTVFNLDWRDGMATSVQKGLLTLPARAQDMLLMTCDMPLVTTDTLNNLVRRWRLNKSRIITCISARGGGLPVIVPRRYFRALMSIKGDPGVSSFLARHAGVSERISLPELRIDVDTRTDARNLRDLDELKQ